MYKITATNQFKKEYKKAKKRGFDIKELEKVVDTLSKGEKLDVKYKDH
jgi:mRNA interferase YafQ